jgi:transposase
LQYILFYGIVGYPFGKEDTAMPFVSKRAKLEVAAEEMDYLIQCSRSRTEGAAKVHRAKVLLAYHQGESISTIAREMRTNRPKVERTVEKALEYGVRSALRDLPRRGRSPRISAEGKAWLVSVACTKPKDLGYAAETWTTRELARHVRKHCLESGYPSLCQLSRGTVSKILTHSEVKPHKIQYYLERRDLEFDLKMAQVLLTYKEVEMIRTSDPKEKETSYVAVLSYDEKPGIQAIQNVAPDLPPVAGKHPSIGRDYEYKRHGVVSLLAAIDLVSGHVHGDVQDRHRSAEFTDFLKQLDHFYAPDIKIRMILDNHSSHISKETKRYLATVPNRFEFIFTPTHGSWLNIIETFFSKATRSFLRAIRVKSKSELKARILQYIDEVNQMPVVFKWKNKMDQITIGHMNSIN